MLSLGAYANADGIIPAGTPIGKKNAVTGLHVILTEAAGALSAPLLGLSHATIKLVPGGNNMVGVVLQGVARSAALPAGFTAAALQASNPNIIIV